MNMSKIQRFSWHITWCALFFAMIPSAESNNDEYLDEAQTSCYKGHDTLSCFKYRALKYVSGMAGESSRSSDTQHQYGNESSRVLQDKEQRLFTMVHIKNPEELDVDDGGFFENSRQMVSDSELEKVFKFGKRQLLSFLRSHGISFGLPRGARAVTDDDSSILSDVGRSDDTDGKGVHSRGKKKKLSILLPLLSLLGLAKIKLLLVPILLSVLFIKKVLVIAALFLPTILSTLKICKVNQPHHSSHQHSGAEISSDYSGGGFGAGYPGYAAAGATGYGKDWAASRAYHGHKMAMERQNPRILSDYQIPVMEGNVVYPTINNA